MRTEDLKDSIRSMAEAAEFHQALSNEFYDLWMKDRLSATQLELFAVNYYARIAPTVRRLGAAFLSLKDDQVSCYEIVKNLYDEFGNGSGDKVHTLMLKRWLSGLLSRAGARPLDALLETQTPLPAVLRLNENSIKLCSGPPAMAAGAILAQEWHAYTQLVKLYEGYRNYLPWFSLNEFHESCEYLYIHIGSAEKEHKEQAIISAERSCRDQHDFEQLSSAFHEFLDLLAAFWGELHRELIRIAAPRPA